MNESWASYLNWIQNGGENILIMVGVILLVIGILFVMIASDKIVKAISVIVTIVGILFIITAMACHAQIYPEDIAKLQPPQISMTEVKANVANVKEIEAVAETGQAEVNELQNENEGTGFHIGTLSIAGFIIMGISMLIGLFGFNSYPLDYNAPLKTCACILLGSILAMTLVSADRGLYMAAEDEKKARIEATEKLTAAAQDDYQILVDGVEFKSVDDIEITNYKTTYDDAGKKVILTSRTESSSNNTFIIYIVLVMAFCSLFYWGKSRS